MADLITITRDHIGFLTENRIFMNAKGDNAAGWLRAGQKHHTTRSLVERYTAHYVGPSFCSLGAFSYSRSHFRPALRIGRYCAIGVQVRLMSADHPIDRLSASGFDYSGHPVFRSAEEDDGVAFAKHKVGPRKPLPVIENDVWIGHDVTIKRGVRIGTGAVIGTGSIVTKDVPPYAVVAGVPATIKRYRFDEATRDRLLASHWWNYRFTDFAGLDSLEPNAFLDGFETRVANGDIQPMPYEPLDLQRELLAITGRSSRGRAATAFAGSAPSIAAAADRILLSPKRILRAGVRQVRRWVRA